MKKYQKQVNQERTKLIHEAIAITRDLGDITFIGAIAVFLHTRSGRESQDLDLVVATSLSDQQLNEKGYSKFPEGGEDVWISARGIYKIDIYRDRPVNDIPISTIIETGVYLPTKKTKLKVASLEVLILMKCRAAREQDREDIEVIVREKYRNIDWAKFKSLTASEIEYQSIRGGIDFIHKG